MSATTGNDFINGTGADETIDGLAGDDTILGQGGRDSLIGNSGDDSLVGSAAGERLVGGDGNDTIFAGESDDLVSTQDIAWGGNGDDSIVGHDNMTTALDGGAGNDTLFSNGEYASVDGREDNDLIFGGSGDYQYLTGGDGNDTILGGAGLSVIIDGQAGADSLTASATGQIVYGGQGDDTIVGGSGNSQILYGHPEAGSTDDNDSIVGGTGTGQRLYGGGGQDTLVAGGGAAQILYGDGGQDSLLGSSIADRLEGGSDNDTLSGGAGNDFLDFGAGDESFLRSASETGNDTLVGGLGNDTLDLGLNWSYLSQEGGFSLYRDEADTIYAQGWEQVVCFAAGTRIVTPGGEDVVENLRAGDMVLAMRNGQAGFEALRWVGFMDIAVPRNAARAAKTAPILIKAGAIAPGMPARDLRVSPDHALEVDGHLIPAKHLVNGESIVQEIWCKRVRYFHLELEAHGLLLSEGTWSESYLDDGNRHAFNNAALTGLFLDFEAGRSKGEYDHLACLPVLRQGLKLEEIHGRLALRAEALARVTRHYRSA
ncbi:MAG: Hint domain-containing protein [Acetobacteraceae bacterium]|nr:Hint domain-containing protein [Acetobacteraceae bacterium]